MYFIRNSHQILDRKPALQWQWTSFWIQWAYRLHWTDHRMSRGIMKNSCVENVLRPSFPVKEWQRHCQWVLPLLLYGPTGRPSDVNSDVKLSREAFLTFPKRTIAITQIANATGAIFACRLRTESSVESRRRMKSALGVLCRKYSIARWENKGLSLDVCVHHLALYCPRHNWGLP